MPKWTKAQRDKFNATIARKKKANGNGKAKQNGTRETILHRIRAEKARRQADINKAQQAYDDFIQTLGTEVYACESDPVE